MSLFRFGVLLSCLVSLIFCLPRHDTSLRAEELEEEIRNLHLRDNLVREFEEGLDTNLDITLFETGTVFDEILRGVKLDFSSLLTINIVSEKHALVGNPRVLLARCEEIFHQTLSALEAGNIGHELLGLLPVYSEVRQVMNGTENVVRSAASSRTTAGDVGGTAVKETSTRIIDALYTWGTLWIAPAVVKGVSMVAQSITSLVQGETGKHHRACSACFLSAMATRAVLYSKVKGDESLKNSDEASNFYMNPSKIDYKSGVCGFPAPEKGYDIDDTYFRIHLSDYFGVGNAINKIIEFGVRPATKAAETIESVVAGNDFQNAVKIVSPLGVRYLIDRFWLQLVHSPPKSFPILGEFSYENNRRTDPQALYDAYVAIAT